MEAMGLDWFPKILIYQFDEIAEKHIGQIQENIGKSRASSKYRGI